MIKLTRINRTEMFWLNENLIEFMEETPDTIISMISGRKIGVAETVDEVIKLIADARKNIIVARNEVE
ncbi:MAG: flagellar FlbD family protein [Eubacteriales bacterium]|jgi:flagellar protein FlbD